MPLPSFTLDSVTYSVVVRQPWNGSGVSGSALVGNAWAYILQPGNDDPFGVVVRFPFTVGSSVDTDNIERDLAMIRLALETDFEGVMRKGRATQYEIDAKQLPYAELL